MAVSPHLLAQVPLGLPTELLRGVVGDDILQTNEQRAQPRKNWVVFSGTHIESNGIGELIAAWKIASLSGWELHITGVGGITETLKKMAEDSASIVFHGMVSREELVRLLSAAKIGVNPQAPSRTPGNVFAFKLIEYLAAGAHVVTTPMGTLEPELERGITYMTDNRPATIAAMLRQVIQSRSHERTAAHAAVQRYGAAAVSRAVNSLIDQVMRDRHQRPVHRDREGLGRTPSKA